MKQVRSRLRRALLRWYRRSARDLPWRRTRDPYCVWVSEIMLQQTRVEAGLPYYLRFIQAYPTVQELAATDEERLLKLWEGLGYYSRAKNLLAAARRIVTEHGGQFPRSVEGWQELPGVGRYTAGAISSIAFGQRSPVLDGNVKRVLARLFAIDQPVEAPAVVRQMWELAEELVPPGSPGDFNQAMMELGAMVCLPRRPRCEECPVRAYCLAQQQGRQEELPIRKAKKAGPHYDVVAGAIVRHGRYLLGKRPDGALLGGLWELPGGKVQPGETHEQALAREIREEVGLEVAVGERLAVVDHAYSHFSITMYVYRCEGRTGRTVKNYHTQLKWVPRRQLARYAMPAATKKILAKL